MRAAPQRPLRPIERWHRATDEVDFGERDRLLARARELGLRHRDAGEILTAYAREQAHLAAEMVKWRAETHARTSGAAHAEPFEPPATETSG